MLLPPRADYLTHMSVPLQVASGNYLCGTVFVALVTPSSAREKAETALQNLFHRPQVKQYRVHARNVGVYFSSLLARSAIIFKCFFVVPPDMESAPGSVARLDRPTARIGAPTHHRICGSISTTFFRITISLSLRVALEQGDGLERSSPRC